jgi:hypothetical protein
MPCPMLSMWPVASTQSFPHQALESHVARRRREAVAAHQKPARRMDCLRRVMLG